MLLNTLTPTLYLASLVLGYFSKPVPLPNSYQIYKDEKVNIAATTGYLSIMKYVRSKGI